MPIFIMVGLMWLFELVDVLLQGGLDSFGIVSRSTSGLFGIAASPLLHGGFGHLIANTVPFIILGLLVAWRSNGRIWPITITIALLGGFAVWLLGPAGVVTIGASGIIFGFFAYLITAGILTRHWLDIAVAGLAILAYGSLIWGVLPFGVGPQVSWLAHLMGAAAGVAAAWIFARPESRPEVESAAL
jgi:membrane associated rhomboid family serine protease